MRKRERRYLRTCKRKHGAFLGHKEFVLKLLKRISAVESNGLQQRSI